MRLLTLALCFLPFAATAEPSAKAAIEAERRIATPEGIEILEQVDVGDDRQWISIRGKNRENPVILFIHGGPGTAMMPLNWAYQNPWEDYFTVVNWDQRGVGKNAVGADRARLMPTLFLDQIVRDGDAVIDHVRKRLNKDKVVVLGFSWGSMVGAHLAHRHPEKVSAYVGVGQAVGPADEAILYRETIAAAERNGDTAAAAELKAMGPYPRPNGDLPLEVGGAVRRHAMRYNGMWYGHDSLKVMQDIAALAPEYTPADVEAFKAGSAWLQETPIMKDMMTDDLRALGAFQVPVVLLLGRYDLATPYAAGKSWFETLKAPKKQLVTFERSSHFVMLEEPGRFFTALLNDVLPLTEGAATYSVLPRSGKSEK